MTVHARARHYTVNRHYTANGLNQYTASGAASLSYDLRGNLIHDGSRSFGYSSENAMISAWPRSLIYDAAGRLAQLDTAAGFDRFGYDGPNLIVEYDGNSLLRRYVHGPGTDEPLVWYEGTGLSTRRYYHADERGSVVATSDGSGAAVNVDTYDEYGIPGSSNSGRFQYTGQQWLGELGMYHYRARIYSPTLGRFLQTDPIGYGDGMNLYAYVGNDAVNSTDPSGLECRDIETWMVHVVQQVWSPGGPGPPKITDKWLETRTVCDSPLTNSVPSGPGDGGGDGEGQVILVTAQRAPDGIQQCSVPARILVGNRNFVGRRGAFGATIRMGSAAIIPRQFGARPGTASMPSWMVSIASIIHGRSTSGQTFMGVTDVMADDSLGATTLIQQNALMARDPGLLLVEIEGGRDEYTTMVIPWPANMPCPHG